MKPNDSAANQVARLLADRVSNLLQTDAVFVAVPEFDSNFARFFYYVRVGSDQYYTIMLDHASVVGIAEGEPKSLDALKWHISNAVDYFRAEQENGESEQQKVESTSDERTVNNVMRHKYRVLSEAEKHQMQSLKDEGLAFIELLHVIGGTDPAGDRQGSRELSLAQTKIEEAVMWAVKFITR